MHMISHSIRLGIILISGFMTCISGYDASAKSPTIWRHIDAARVAELARLMPAKPAGLGPRCSDRQPWMHPLVQRKLKPFIATALKILDRPFPPWSDQAYLIFSKTGSRREGERMMSTRWKKLAPLVLAECAEARGRFIPMIERALSELAKQPTWTIPALDEKLLSLQQKQFHVALVAATTGHNLAQALYMLDNWIRPPVRELVLKALRERVFDPILKSLKAGQRGWGSHWWIVSKTNWNAVCSVGVTGAALAVLQRPRERATFVASAESSSRYYIDGFLDDGYSTEGLSYWNYGFSHFVLLRQLVLRTTRNKLDLFANPKIRLIAQYGERIEMSPGISAAFGDSLIGAMPDPFTLAYDRAAFSAKPQHGLPGVPVNKTSLPMAAVTLFSTIHPVTPTTVRLPATRTKSSYFPTAGVLVSRAATPDGRLAATIKANGNSRGHSHNDIGSYSIAFAHGATVGDVGKTHYSRKTFGKLRYEIRAINSYGHPVPVVADRPQRNAVTVHVPVMKVTLQSQQDEMVIDMLPAYPVPELKKLTRTFVHKRRTPQNPPNVTIEDQFEFTTPLNFEVALTTRTHARIGPDGTVLFTVGDEHSLRATIRASAPYELRRETISEEGLTFTRYGIRLKKPSREGSIRVTYTSVK